MQGYLGLVGKRVPVGGETREDVQLVEELVLNLKLMRGWLY
jgi:hypothetical protein